MDFFSSVLIFGVGLSTLYWIAQNIIIFRTIQTVDYVKDLNYPIPDHFPKISVIIAARNEEKTIKEALSSRLRDPNPNLELILVNDRSEDKTGKIIDQMAKKDSRIKPLHLTHLPQGWLGKVHAMKKGVEIATGEWFLFSDADVYLEPGALNQVILYCQKKNLDHLAILPEFYSSGFVIDTVVAMFLKALIVGGRIYRLKKEKTTMAVGSGGFNLVKREIFEKSRGFSWLRLEIVDDVTLGQMLKEAGARGGVLHGRDQVGVHWYSDFRGMVDGLGRAVAAGVGKCSLFILLTTTLSFFILDILPFVILIPLGISWLPWVGVSIIILELIASITAGRWFGLPVLPLIILPLGYILSLTISLLGGFRIFLNRGVNWRGTFYSKKELRKGRRFRVFF